MDNIQHLIVEEFFVFDDAHTDEDSKSESEKILYFYPNGKSEDDQLRSVGLCEALLSFSRFFSSPCTAVHTQNGKKFFHQISNHFWAVMSVCSLQPSSTIPAANNKSAQVCEHTINDSLMLKALESLCNRFELLHGQLGQSVSGSDRSQTRADLSNFFPNELLMLDLMSFDIVDWLDGLQFHHIDADIFLHVENFLNQIEFSCPFPVFSALFLDYKLLWSSLPLHEMRVINHFLIETIFGLPPDLEQTTISPKAIHMGRFLTGPSYLGDMCAQMPLPLIYRPDKSGDRFQVIVYQALRAVLCLFVEEKQELDLQFYKTFDGKFGYIFTEFATRLAASADKPAAPSRRISVPPTSKNLTSLDSIRSPENGVFSLSISALVWDSDLYSITSSLHTFSPNGSHKTNPAVVPFLSVLTSLREDTLACFTCSRRCNYADCTCRQLGPVGTGCGSRHIDVLLKLEPDVWILYFRLKNREIFITFTGKKIDLNAVLEESRQRLSSIYAGQLFI